MEKITSVGNEKIKYAFRLASDSAFASGNGEFLAEGARLCSDIAQSGIAVKRAFITSKAAEKYSGYISEIEKVCGEIFEIGDNVARKLGGTDNPQGIFCVCSIPARDESAIDFGGIYLALENVRDPANIGAICRSAEALGIDGIITSGSCFIYSPKVLRSAMGSSVRIPVIETHDLCALLAKARSEGALTLASVPRADACDIRCVEKHGGIICCLGNEGNGLTAETVNACEKTVTIPMSGRAESFNVAAAAAILAWELKR